MKLQPNEADCKLFYESVCPNRAKFETRTEPWRKSMHEGLLNSARLKYWRWTIAISNGGQWGCWWSNEHQLANWPQQNLNFFHMWGCWTQPQWCPSGYLLAFRMQVESSQGAGDDTSANTIDFRCTDGSMLMGQGSNFGTYGSWSNDCGGKAICGMRTKIEEWTSAGDDTALNDVQFYCCDE
uniref:Vitelline membrane outer layer protein 1 homolog n=1 Tax=Eptatretus burgeri TaxID=7764 RepID=A0A8C4R2K4_EPTBU